MPNDYTGQKFGKLTVIKGIEINNSKNKPNFFKKYQCLCDCGNYIDIFTYLLNRGTKSCGCLRIYSNLTDRLKPGMKINRFTVQRFSKEKLKWEFLCDCGNIYYSDAKRILNGNTQSCGCLSKDNGRAQAIALINKKSDPDPIKILSKRIHKCSYSDGDLLYEDFMHLSQLPCFYCDAEKQNKRTKKPSEHSYLSNLSEEELTFRYNGIDRIDSSLPHDKSNCVPACKTCNQGKSNMGQEDFIIHLKRISKNEINLSFEEYRSLAENIDFSVFTDKKRFSVAKSIRHVYKQRYSDGNLKIEEMYKLSQLPCYYCGLEKSNKINRASHVKKSSQFAKDTGDYFYNGLDRIDYNLKHDINNIVPACCHCNFIKRDLSYNDFMTWVSRLKLKYNK